MNLNPNDTLWPGSETPLLDHLLDTYDVYVPKNAIERWLCEEVLRPIFDADLALSNDNEWRVSIHRDAEHGGWNDQGVYTAFIHIRRNAFDLNGLLNSYRLPISLFISPVYYPGNRPSGDDDNRQPDGAQIWWCVQTAAPWFEDYYDQWGRLPHLPMLQMPDEETRKQFR